MRWVSFDIIKLFYALSLAMCNGDCDGGVVGDALCISNDYGYSVHLATFSNE